MTATRKEQILAVSAKLFRQKGFQATTMRDIARDTGVEAASLYNHISSKQVILRELLLDIARLFTEGMKDIKDLSIPNLTKLEKLIDLHVAITVSHTDAISLIPSEWVHLVEPQLKAFLKLRDDYEKDFKKILTSYLSEDESSSLDADVALFSILSSLRWLYSWYSKYKVTDLDKLKADLKQSLIHGLH